MPFVFLTNKVSFKIEKFIFNTGFGLLRFTRVQTMKHSLPQKEHKTK